MTRDTKEITSLSGKKAVIYIYLSARQTQEINASIIGDQKTELVEGAKVSLPLSAGVLWEKKTIEAALVSFDEVTTDPIERMLDLPNEEYADLKKQIYAQLKVNLKPAI